MRWPRSSPIGAVPKKLQSMATVRRPSGPASYEEVVPLRVVVGHRPGQRVQSIEQRLGDRHQPRQRLSSRRRQPVSQQWMVPAAVVGHGVIAAVGTHGADPAPQPPARRPRHRLDLVDHGEALCRERSPVVRRGGQVLQRPVRSRACGIELLQPEPRGRVVDVVGPPAPDRSQRRGEPVRQVGATSQHLAPPVVPVLRPGGVAELQGCPREVGEVDDFQDDPPRPRQVRACLRGADDPVQPGRDGVDELDTERFTRPLQRPCVGCVEDLTHHWRQPLGRQHRGVLHGPILGDGGPAGYLRRPPRFRPVTGGSPSA